MTDKKLLNGNNNGKQKIIGVIGLGYVGLPLAILADKKGYKVIGFDIDKEKVEKINHKERVFTDERLTNDIKDTNIIATSDPTTLKSADIIIVCVPTPVYKNHTPDLRPLMGAAEFIGKNLKNGQNIIIESTVNPGVSEAIVLPIIKKLSGDKFKFHFSYCPERINPGDNNWHLENIPRVIGSLDQEGLELALKFYRSVIKAEIRPMASIREAEAVKIVENSFRDINIAFVNELALSFSRMNIDIMNVLQGAATKPFGFMTHLPGCGVGGHCIPVDPYYLIEYARKNGFIHRFLSLARQINNEMPVYTAELAMSSLTNTGLPVRGSKVTVLGLAYKADIDDHRESPSLGIIAHLNKFGVRTEVYDPFIPDRSTAGSLEESLTDAKVIVIATAHSQFIKKINPATIKKYGILAVVDGRNCLDPDSFIEQNISYVGIGRGKIPENYIKSTLIAENNAITKASV